MARLIVERSTIMSHLFSKRSCGAGSDAVLAALLSIFSRHVQRMRKSKEGEEVYSWVRRAGAPGPAPRPSPRPAHRLLSLQSESQDQVFLRWTSGETATMHILVVHAMVILLTLGPPRGEQPAGGGAWVSRGGGPPSLPVLGAHARASTWRDPVHCRPFRSTGWGVQTPCLLSPHAVLS